jgi:hypothetical protein
MDTEERPLLRPRSSARHRALGAIAAVFVALVLAWVVRALAGGPGVGWKGAVAFGLAASFSVTNLAVGVFLLRRFRRDRTVGLLFCGMVGAAAAFGLPAQQSLSSDSTAVVAATLTFEVLTAVAYVLGLWGLSVSPDGSSITLSHPPSPAVGRILAAAVGAIALVLSLDAVAGVDPFVLAFAIAVTVLANGLIAQLVHAERNDPEEHRSALIFSGLLEMSFVGSALVMLLYLAVSGWGVDQFTNPLETSGGDPKALLAVVAPLFVGLPVVLILAVTRHGLATLQKPFGLLSLRQVEYLVLSLVITGGYVAVHVGTDWLFERTVEPLHLPELLVTALVTLGVVVLFEPFKERLSDWTRRRLDTHGEGTHAVIARMLEEFASAADPGDIPWFLAKWAKKASRAAGALVTVGRTSASPGREFWCPRPLSTRPTSGIAVRYRNASVGFVAIVERTQRWPWSLVPRRRPTSRYRWALLRSLASASAMAMWVASEHAVLHPDAPPRPSPHRVPMGAVSRQLS